MTFTYAGDGTGGAESGKEAEPYTGWLDHEIP